MAKKSIDSTTQEFLDIYDITNNMVIMKNGTTSMVLTVDAMNFGLLAEEEQDSVMYAYAGLLNSLNYPIQIIVRSQTKDVTGYLSLLKEQEDKAGNHRQRQRMQRYREFVGNLIHERNVLDKKFYVVIPASPIELGLLTPQSVLPGSAKFDITSVERSVIVEKAKNLLEPKRDHLISQFARIGLYSRELNTQEVIQLFYLNYNPEASEGQHIDESNSYNTPLVRAGMEGFSMINANNPQSPNAAAPQGDDATTSSTQPSAPAGGQMPTPPSGVTPSTPTPSGPPTPGATPTPSATPTPGAATTPGATPMTTATSANTTQTPGSSPVAPSAPTPPSPVTPGGTSSPSVSPGNNPAGPTNPVAGGMSPVSPAPSTPTPGTSDAPIATPSPSVVRPPTPTNVAGADTGSGDAKMAESKAQEAIDSSAASVSGETPSTTDTEGGGSDTNATDVAAKNN